MNKTIKPAERISGEIKVPGDKSISHRVAFLGSIAKGETKAANFLQAEDCMNTVSAMKNMGIDITFENDKIKILGNGLRGLKKPSKELYLGNSGTTMRVLPGILAGQDFETTLTGDSSLSKRPMQRIEEPLRQMGVDITLKGQDKTPPIVVKGGKVKSIKYSTKVASAQVKSCVLFAGLYGDGTTSVTEPFVSRNHTERMLEFFSGKVLRENFTVSVSPGELSGGSLFVPGDVSSAAFFIAAACILKDSELTIREVGLNETRMGFLSALIRMGASITVENKKDAVEPYGDIKIKYAPLKGAVIEKPEIPFLIDEVPILAVLAARAEGQTIIKGVTELRVKETDRVLSITENLKSMGVDIEASGEDLIINGGVRRFKKGTLNSYKDHRTAMSMAIASLCADGDSEIKDTSCVNTSFPQFFDLINQIR